MIAKRNDDPATPVYHSLDAPYFHVSDAKLYKLAILSSKRGMEADLKRGDKLERLVSSGLRYYEYKADGFYYGCNERTSACTDYASFKLKNSFQV